VLGEDDLDDGLGDVASDAAERPAPRAAVERGEPAGKGAREVNVGWPSAVDAADNDIPREREREGDP